MEAFLVTVLVLVLATVCIYAAYSHSRAEKARKTMQNDVLKVIQDRLTIDHEMMDVMKTLINEADSASGHEE